MSITECEIDFVFSDHITMRNNDEIQGLKDDGDDVSFEDNQN